MNRICRIIRPLVLLLAWTLAHAEARAQVPTDSIGPQLSALTDSIEMELGADGTFFLEEDSARLSGMVVADTARKARRDWNTWRPNPKRAMWLAAVLPGAGQIYNRKYWKLPIIYGGFIGCFYAIRWNNMMYKDYSQAYMDIMDDNPETHSYDQFLHLGAEITQANMANYQNKFKRRKDYYRRYRDLSAFIMMGVYAISIIDAYVDASLSEFDISDDLSMKVTPVAMKNSYMSLNPVKSTSIGVQCSIYF